MDDFGAAPGAMIGAIFVFVPSLGNFVVPELLGGKKTVTMFEMTKLVSKHIS